MMPHHILPRELRGRMAADLSARRGPFALDVVSLHDVRSHYGYTLCKVTASREFMRVNCVRMQKVTVGTGPAGIVALYVLSDDPRYAGMGPSELFAEFRRTHPWLGT